ncbi:MAG: type I-B CRISPR-associated protein Cas5b [Candidatus Helarchaeota archaeon]
MKILVFDIFAPYGHFRVPYTTTSPITFPVPPKTAIAGMIGSIIGLDRLDYLNYFQNGSMRIAIKVLNPIRKTIINENFINTKKVGVSKYFARMKAGTSNRTQINVEFLKNPGYRLFISHKVDSIMKYLESYLVKHSTYYTLTMGLSECIANFTYIGKFETNEKRLEEGEYIELDSILPLSVEYKLPEKLEIIEGRKLIKVKLPLELSSSRELVMASDFLIEQDGQTIPVQLKRYELIKNINEKVIFF